MMVSNYLRNKILDELNMSPLAVVGPEIKVTEEMIEASLLRGDTARSNILKYIIRSIEEMSKRGETERLWPRDGTIKLDQALEYQEIFLNLHYGCEVIEEYTSQTVRKKTWWRKEKVEKTLRGYKISITW